MRNGRGVNSCRPEAEHSAGMRLRANGAIGPYRYAASKLCGPKPFLNVCKYPYIQCLQEHLASSVSSAVNGLACQAVYLRGIAAGTNLHAVQTNLKIGSLHKD